MSVLCEFRLHGRSHFNGRYGEDGEPATVYVRVTCAHCDHFRVWAFCQGCLDGVKTSGRNWRCQQCNGSMSPETKMKYIVRMGDIEKETHDPEEKL